jgi:hypothetical protein
VRSPRVEGPVDIARHFVHWLVSIPTLISESLSESAKAPVTSRDIPIRVLRSTFRRGDETLICELALEHDDEFYEIRTTPPLADGHKNPEKFPSVTKAFRRQSEIEARLVDAGWTLEAHESILT